MQRRSRQSPRRRRLNELRRRITLLRAEIATIEQNAGAAPGPDAAQAEHVVEQLRKSVIDPELATKRNELEALLAQVRQLEAELVDDPSGVFPPAAISEPQPADVAAPELAAEVAPPEVGSEVGPPEVAA